MTKEEYERLLNSEYWKGYSYSLIKERNFTCEDCGRQFWGERNKLQVHHLVYRDINPWSYKPKELLVLCEECHKKRHGIIPDTHNDSQSLTSTDSTSVKDEGEGYVKSYTPYSNQDRPNKSFNSARKNQNKRKLSASALFAYAIAFLCFCFVVNIITQSENDTEDVEVSTVAVDTIPAQTITKQHDEVLTEREVDSIVDDVNKFIAADKASTKRDSVLSMPVPAEEKPSVKAEVTEEKVAEEVGKGKVVVEKKVEKKKKPYEGLSTLEILERRNHADVVKQAKRAGVSTEGTTLEILERINHADVVKQAKRAGVSTEGTTLEILERINRKELENSNW